MQMEHFEKFSEKDASRCWRGSFRKGMTGIPEICRKLDYPETVFIKDRPKITIGLVDGFFVKRYNMPGVFTQIRNRFKRSRVKIFCSGAELLHKIGIPTPQVMAMVFGYKGWKREDYLVTEILSPECRVLSNLSQDEAWKAVLFNVLPMLIKCHNSGLYHGDLSLRNIYIDGSGNAGLIDLDGVKLFAGKVPDHFREKELARLLTGFTIKFLQNKGIEKYIDEFWQIYQQNTTDLPDKKRFLKCVEHFVQKGKKYFPA